RAERLQAEDANDALGERTPIHSHCEHRCTAPFLHQREGTSILDSIATEQHGHVIAAMFAFCANTFVQPPDRGMVEEQRLNTNLEYVHKGIEPLNVRQFVSDHGLKLVFGKPRESSYRQEHDRAKPSNHRRRLQPSAFTVFNRASQAELVLEREADFENSRTHNRGLPAAFAFEQQKSASGTE